MSNILWIILVAVAVVIVWIIMAYNKLIALRNRTDESFSDIDVQLKRRYDLIPNLVATVKGYATHESSVFEKVTQARSNAMQATGLADKAQAENALSQTLKSLFAVSESYPELKASQNFLQLQDELSDTENKIQAARRFYNGNVRDFNTAIQVFPTNIIAGQLKFTAKQFFGIDEKEKEPVQVQF